MNEKVYTITLEDGTRIENLHLNGNNFISQEKIDSKMFDANLGKVIISDGDVSEVHKNMELVQITEVNNEYWFIIIDISDSEMEKRKLRSDLDYVIMMTNLDI